MTELLASIASYSSFIYQLPERYPSVETSTLVVKPIGREVAEVEGDLFLPGGIRLEVLEVVAFLRPAITRYWYAVYRGQERLYWYDPQPHPNDPSLASTHPHHKHIPPDIKHHRVPAPGLSFEQPNLPLLIEEIQRTLLPQELPPASPSQG